MPVLDKVLAQGGKPTMKQLKVVLMEEVKSWEQVFEKTKNDPKYYGLSQQAFGRIEECQWLLKLIEGEIK